MSKMPETKKITMDSIKESLFKNKVVLLFVVLCLACTLVADTPISYIVSDVFARFGRNTCLVLALIIPCLAGLGMNFGIVVGAMAAQISIFWVVHWGFTGIGGFLLCALISTPIAVFFGWLVGKLYNKTKGSEMIAGLVLGYFVDGIYQLIFLWVIGGVIPVRECALIINGGVGVKNTIDLTGNLKYALDTVSMLDLSFVIAIAAIVVAILRILFAGKNADKKVIKKSIGKDETTTCYL